MNLRPAPAHSTTHVISYAPPVGSRRRWIRRSAYVLGLALILSIAWAFGPTVRDRISLFNLQRQCLSVIEPTTKVVFENESDQSVIRKMVLLDGQYVRSEGSVLWFCEPWEKFYAQLSPPGRKTMATVFIGERHCAGGPPRLIVIEAKPFRDSDIMTSFPGMTATVIEPGSVFRPARIISSGSPKFVGIPGRIFAGQPDPVDTASIRIDSQLNETHTGITARLNADDTVTIY